MNYVVLKAETLLNMKLSKVEGLSGLFVLEFCNGRLPMTPGRLLMTWQLWEVIRRNPPIKLRKEFALGSEEFDTGITFRKYEAIVLEMIQTYGSNWDPEKVSLDLYETQNLIYNDSISRYARHVTSIDIFDFVDISTHPKMIEARNVTPFDEAAVDNTYKVNKEIMNLPEFRNRTAARTTRAKIVPIAPANQCNACVGFNTDYDDRIFPRAINVGYTKGIRNLADAMAESRKTTRSLFYQSKPMQQAEWFRRELEILTEVIKDVVGDVVTDSDFVLTGDSTDCGSTEYVSYELKDKRELSLWSGATYRTTDHQELRPLLSSDTHLIGKVLHFRSPVYCRHMERGKVCATCYGLIHKSLPRMTNIGHLAGSEFTHSTSQSVVGMKHLIATAVSQSVSLDAFTRRYMSQGSDGRSLKLSNKLKGRKVRLLIQQKAIKNIVDVNVVEDFSRFRYSRIGDVTEVVIEVDGQGYEIQTTMATTPANLTSKFLEYAKKKSWTSDRRKYLVFDMEDWDFSNDILCFPMKGASIYEKMKSVKAFMFKAPQRNAPEGQLSSFMDPGDALLALFRITADFVSVNIVHQAIIVRAMMTADIAENDFRSPIPGDSFRLADQKRLMNMRSAGSMMAYQEQPRFLNSVSSYIYTNRPPQGFDAIFS